MTIPRPPFICNIAATGYRETDVSHMFPKPPSFAEIWEKDGTWLMGRWLLGEIVEHLRGRSLEATARGGNVTIALPLPTIATMTLGELVAIRNLVPEELLGIFDERCEMIIETRLTAIERVAGFIGRQINAPLLAEINAILKEDERQRDARFEPLWLTAGEMFGLAG